MTIPTTQPSQAAREAALPFVDCDYTKKGGYSDGYWIQRGEYDDHPLVQAFTRFERDTEKRLREQAAPYLANRFDWAAPGDQQEDAWLVRFCDKDCGEAIFTGPDAEREAWEYWNRYSPAYNLYVFRLARLRESLAGEANVERVAGEEER